MVRVQAARVVEAFEVELSFTDGTRKILDLARFLEGPIFEPLREEWSLFNALRVDEELGTIVWPNGADLCPDALFMEATGRTVEELFPSLKQREAVGA